MSDAKAKRPTIPTKSELAASEVPAVILRSPRLVRFIVTGAVVGLVFGALAALLAPGHGLQYRAVVVGLMSLGFGFLGALIAGAVATRRGRGSHAATGSIAGFALGLGLFWMILPDEPNLKIMGVGLLVVVGMSVFGGMLGRSFPVGGEPVGTASISGLAVAPPQAKPPAKAVAKKPATGKPSRTPRRTKGN